MVILAVNKFATMSRDIFDELLHGTLMSDDEYCDTNKCSIEGKKLEFVLNLTSVNIYSSEAALYTLECEGMERVYNGAQLEDAVSTPPLRNAPFPNSLGSFVQKSTASR